MSWCNKFFVSLTDLRSPSALFFRAVSFCCEETDLRIFNSGNEGNPERKKILNSFLFYNSMVNQLQRLKKQWSQ